MGVNKDMFDRFSIHQINAPSSCCYLSKVLLQKKRHGAMQKLFIKKKKKELKKWISVRDSENNGYSDAHLKKEEKDQYDSPCFFAKLFLNSKREICFQGA